MGDTGLNGLRPAPAAATVRARSRMRVLLVRSADAAALVTQPSIKAALYRTQTESSVLDALETFAAYGGEVAAIDEVRRSRAASFAAAGVRVGGGGGGLLLGGGGSEQWACPVGLVTASSAGSSALESYGSVASSLASFTSAGVAAASAGSPSSSATALLQAQAAAAGYSSRSSSLPTVSVCIQPNGSFSLPFRVPSRTAGTLGGFLGAEGAGLGVTVVGGGGSPLRPGSRGNSFTAGSTTPTKGGLRGTSSRLGLAVGIPQQFGAITSPLP